ncbi:cilia- and flagella-associated protein 99-like [Genypterus blacodes]|uniref:cilia- and flagella-associated protein 99-like n=1 Tax=Genypterus blacodes TaxID=154954 RepID=UPI003F7752AA
MSQIEEEFDSKLRVDSFQASELPASHTMTNSNLPIKLNSSAILRQRVQHNRQVEKEQQRLERLMEGAGEPSSFHQWQKEMRERDLQEEVVKIEARRIEGRISNDKAAMARTYTMEHKQKAAQLHKEEIAQQMRCYAEKRLQEGKEIRDLVQQGHKNSKAAKRKLLELKQNIVKEVSEQNQALLRQALEEAQAELSRKFETIREIHAIESVTPIRRNVFDDTETGGHGVLGEMSLVELKERLAVLKEAQQSDLKERRMRILEEKQSKKQLLTDSMDAMNLHRKALVKAAATRGEEKRTTRLDLLQAVGQDERILALKREAEKTKQERQRLEQTERSKIKTSGKKNFKVNIWEQLEEKSQLQFQGEVTDIIS